MNKKKRLLATAFVLMCLLYICFILFTNVVNKIGNKPTITLPNTVLSISVKASESDLLKDVKANDKEDGNLTDKVFIESISSFNENKERTITYGVFDSDDHLVKATRQIKYTDYKEPTISLIKPLVYYYYIGGDEEYKQFIKATSSIDGDITPTVIMNFSEDSGRNYYIEYSATDSCGTQVNKKYEVTALDNKPNIEINLKEYEIDVPLGTTITEIAPKDTYLGDIYIDGMKNNLLKAEVEVLNNYDATKVGTYEFIYRISKANGDFGYTKLIVNVK